MYYIKWVFTLLIWGFIASILFYTLPQHDIVRVVNTEVRRVDFGENSWFWTNPGTGDAQGMVSRDVFFVDTFRPNDRPIVYRNEDTGWGWPPYFKLNSANLQAEMRDLISTKDSPEWVAVRHYGVRFEPLSIYPNALTVHTVTSPDTRIINWFNIVFLVVFSAILIALWIRWQRFREARIDPVLDNIEDGVYAAGQNVKNGGRRFRRWLDGWRS